MKRNGQRRRKKTAHLRIQSPRPSSTLPQTLADQCVLSDHYFSCAAVAALCFPFWLALRRNQMRGGRPLTFPQRAFYFIYSTRTTLPGSLFSFYVCLFYLLFYGCFFSSLWMRSALVRVFFAVLFFPAVWYCMFFCWLFMLLHFYDVSFSYSVLTIREKHLQAELDFQSVLV